jgi:hypothetical protein
MPKAKHPIQEFNGIRFYRTRSGYYRADPRKHKHLYMHRYVWTFHNGLIPPGYHVHHKNHLRADNRIENLELAENVAHAKHHGALADKDLLREHMRTVVRPMADRWHGSEEGKKFHSALGEYTWKVRPKAAYTCTHCGGEFEAYVGVQKAGFCSAKCQSAARRASGVDNVTAQCAYCGAEFTKNKYAKTKHCSQSCGSKSARATSVEQTNQL